LLVLDPKNQDAGYTKEVHNESHDDRDTGHMVGWMTTNDPRSPPTFLSYPPAYYQDPDTPLSLGDIGFHHLFAGRYADAYGAWRLDHLARGRIHDAIYTHYLDGLGSAMLREK
jgi:tetratricopeptide (TPR) repeat protein